MATTAVDIVVKTLGLGKLKELDKTLKGTAAEAVKTAKGVDELTGKLSKSGQQIRRAANGLEYFVDKAGRARKVTGEFVSTSEAAAAGIRKFGDNAKTAGKKVETVKTGVEGLTKAVRNLLAATAVLQTAKFIIGNTAELETQTRSLQVLTGELDTAKQIINELQKFAAVTPFKSSELIETAKRLKAFGVDTNRLVDTTKRLGDVAGATGAELGGIATAYGQIAAKGRLQGEELLQLQERGVDLQSELQKMYGLTGEEFRKALEKGKFSAEAVEVALVRLTEKGGKYADGAIAQSDTLAGKFSTLQDGIEGLARKLGTVLAPELKRILDLAIDAVNNINAAFAASSITDRQKQGFKSQAEAEVRRFAGPLPGGPFGAGEVVVRTNGKTYKGSASSVVSQITNDLINKEIENRTKASGPKIPKSNVQIDQDIPDLLGDKDKGNDDGKKGTIKKLYDFTNKNEAALAKNKIRLDRQVFDNAIQLEELKFKKQQELAEKLQNIQQAGLNANARSVFNSIKQFSRGTQQVDSEVKNLEQRIIKAERDLADAKAGRVVSNLQSAPTSFSSPGSSQLGNSNVQAVLQAAEKNIGLMAGSSERCADALRELFKQTGIGIGVTKEAWDGLASGGRLASSFFGSDIGEKITNIRDLRPGDLVGFEQTYGNWGKGVQTHVGIYAGDGMMFDHSSSKGLTKRSMQGTFPGKFLYGVRPDAYGQQPGQGIMPGGQADMSSMLSQAGNVEMLTTKLNGLNEQLEVTRNSSEQLKAADFSALLATQSQLFDDQTSAIERQAEALQLKGRLEIEGLSPERIEGELKKLEVTNKLKDSLEGYTAALEIGLITEEQYAALRGAATASAAKQAGAIDQLTEAQVKYNETVAQQQQLQGLASGIASEVTSALSSVIKGTKDVNEAFADMLQGIADQFLNMAMKILQDAITQQLVKLFAGLAGGFSGGGTNIAGGAQLIGAAFADGGRPPLGKVSLVGEKGPELFVPDQAGTVISNDEAFGDAQQAMTTAVANNVTAFEQANEAMGMATATRAANTTAAAETSAMQTAEAYFTSGKSTVTFDTYRVGEMDVVTREDAIRIGQQSAKQAEANVYKGLRNMPAIRSRSGVK